MASVDEAAISLAGEATEKIVLALLLTDSQ
jgi:hypothetical protein